VIRRLIAVGLAVSVAGCSLSAFDDRRAGAPSQSRGAPDGVASSDYGAAIAPVTLDRPGVAYAVLGRDPLTLTTVTSDDTGGLIQAGIDLTELAPEPGDEVTVAGSPAPVRGMDGAVAVGGLGDDGILLFDARDGDQGPQYRTTFGAEDCGGDPLPDLGRSMAFIRTDLGAPDEPELVALSGSDLVVFVDAKPDFEPTCLRCTLTYGEGLAVTGADIGLNDGDEIFVAVSGQLIVFAGTNVERHSESGADCFTQYTPQISGLDAPVGEVGDGVVIAAGDGGGPAAPEVAMYEPSTERVYVVPNLEDSGPGGLPFVLSGDPDAGAFGTALAFGDLDGDDDAELIIGDPGADVDGLARAGNAVVYDFRDGEPEIVTRLHDSTPVSDQAFGRSLAVAPFTGPAGDTDLLVTGAAGEVFTYFRALPDGDDPR
jgi:hypothetical protein